MHPPWRGGGAAEGRDPLSLQPRVQQCLMQPCRGMGRWGLSMALMPWPDPAPQDGFVAEELHKMG